MLQDLIKITVKARQKKELVLFLIDEYRVSIRRACRVISFHCQNWYYRAVRRDDEALRQRIRDITTSLVLYSFERNYILLRREGWKDNHKRVYRIYCEESLHLRSKRPRCKKATGHRQQHPIVYKIDECWSMPGCHRRGFCIWSAFWRPSI